MTVFQTQMRFSRTKTHVFNTIHEIILIQSERVVASCENVKYSEGTSQSRIHSKMHVLNPHTIVLRDKKRKKGLKYTLECSRDRHFYII